MSVCRNKVYEGVISLLVLCGMMFVGAVSFAQAQNGSEQDAAIFQISEQSLKADKLAVEENTGIAAEDKKQILDIYDAAFVRLAEGSADNTKSDVFKSLRDSAADDITRLEQEIEEVRADLAQRSANLSTSFADMNLEELEALLVERRSEASALRTSQIQFQTARRALDQRPATAREELAATQEKIAELRAQISAPSAELPTAQDKSSKALAQANLVARQAHKRMLEQEIASIPSQRSILARRISLTAAKILQTDGLITALQIKTGSARTMNAEQRYKDARSDLDNFSSRHPVVLAYATENINLSLKLSQVVQSEEDIPRSEALIRTQLSQIEADTNVADQILGTKKSSKNYSVHLRQLRKKQPSMARIKNQIRARDAAYQDALFERIINQEAQQIFNTTPLDMDAEIARLSKDINKQATEQATEGEVVVDNVEITDEDREALQRLYDSRRELLSALASFSVLKAEKLQELNELQSDLLVKVQGLCERLDGRLLWLPSTDAVGLQWPAMVGQGLIQTFNPQNLSLAGTSFVQGVRQSAVFLILFALIALGAMSLRRKFVPVMDAMRGQVGRVQNDSYSLTPIAVLQGALTALPWAAIPFAIGVIYMLSKSESEYVGGLARSGFVAAQVVFIFLTLRAWATKGALFDVHYRVDWELRNRLNKHIPWLVVTQIISVIFIALTGYGVNFDPGPSALGVLGFLIGAISISVFAIKLAWSRSKAFHNYAADKDGIYIRNEKWFFLLAIGIPLMTSLLAVFGYFETARLLLTRFFLSFSVLIAAYVIHGLLRRSVVIAQRRLALEQARARRDRAVKERMEKVAAEERGEVPTPKLDYDSIDLETINRQSSQLVSMAVFIAAAGALWALWGNLLPALSVFNDIEAWGYDKLDDAGRVLINPETLKPIHVAISYWNIMQGMGIGLITWFAARNLPGFLEIFVLKRMNMIQGSRFAIVTVLRYMIFTIGVIIAFNKLGTQWSQLQWIIAALGVGIGFGLQAIFANFISGLIILFERPVRIGDFITIGAISGTITRIQIRATTLLDLDNKEILIPNQELISQHVTNWTLTNAVTRLIVNVGIAYGSDTQKAHAIMLKTVKENPNVLGTPEPNVLFLGFGDSSLDFELRVFLRSFGQRFVVSHELHMAIDQALREAGIEIPFPQRDLHIKNPQDLRPQPATAKQKPK
jgi:potassium efflux system protein